MTNKGHSATRQYGGVHEGGKGALEILYAMPDQKDDIWDVAKRDLPGDLRERYWIEQAKDAGINEKTWTNLGITIPWKIERHELGRSRNEPGDGFGTCQPLSDSHQKDNIYFT